MGGFPRGFLYLVFASSSRNNHTGDLSIPTTILKAFKAHPGESTSVSHSSIRNLFKLGIFSFSITKIIIMKSLSIICISYFGDVKVEMTYTTAAEMAIGFSYKNKLGNIESDETQLGQSGIEDILDEDENS
ncbi:hypothetical protein LguiA_016666 [Lonicera macranthoides]